MGVNKIYGVSESEFTKNIPSYHIKEISNNKCNRIVFLKCDVEAYVKREQERLHNNKLKESKKEWKNNSFSIDRNGKSHKWKEWNSVTFQRQVSNVKKEVDNFDFT